MSLVSGLLIAIVLHPLIFTVVAKSNKGYSNKTPRAYLAAQSGHYARAHWAQTNAFESLAQFAPCFAYAIVVGASSERLAMWMMVYLAARLAYGACYILDWDKLRSGCWLVGVVSIIGIVVSTT